MMNDLFIMLTDELMSFRSEFLMGEILFKVILHVFLSDFMHLNGN